MHGEDQHLGAVVALDDLAGGLDAVQLRKGDVHDDDVRMDPLDELRRAATVSRLADDLDLLVGLEQTPQTLSHDGVVVNQEDSNLSH